MLIPIGVAVHLIPRIERVAADQALGQAQGHGRVVRPLSWLQVEGSAAHHVGQRFEAAAWLELQRGANGVACGQAEQSASVSIL